MSSQSNKEMKKNIEDVMRASWFARLALGHYSVAPDKPEQDPVTDTGFRQQAIDLCS